MVHTLLMTEVFSTQNSEVEDLLVVLLPTLNPCLFFSYYLFGFGFKPTQDYFQQDIARVTDKADGSVLLAEL